jgi:hypothetical protein
MDRMEFQAGEWVQTDSGAVGKVVYTSRLTVFVALPDPPKPDRVEAFLASQLTRTKPPDRL